MSKSYYEKIAEATSFVRGYLKGNILDAVILGTGLGSFVDSIDIEERIPYKNIPHFPVSTVESHQGELIIGKLKGKPIIVMSGRFHYYEGYSMKEVTFPVRLFQLLGVENIFITNVAGGTNADYEAGDLVVIKDHINFMPENPLRGQNDSRLGVRFPDLKNTYCPDLRVKAHGIAKEMKIDLKEGIYFSLAGPNLETPAEYEFIHRSGADLVGMSTVPEVIVAKHAEMNIFAVSIVSNVCYPTDRIQETSIDSVIEVAHLSGEKLSALLGALIP
ncbi:purine-nucleoside phosphorylase [Portibacter lacus]|uniref:Purine nucleoside phosphorylase n=1 Tax=Portibacter lacus TaxID=1099794 RepID=A0AA37SQX1_9BACT|nr:purine-nucleoside phosphorylase [Portibacter lacus]GLR18049.1 purine nucleoside phosphorylase [Portibacter lacus]